MLGQRGLWSSRQVPAPPRSLPKVGPKDVIVVLGCRVVEGRPSASLRRRLEQAALLHAAHPELPIILSGGKTWGQVTESATMRRWWEHEGPGTGTLIEESSSQTTRENALRVAELCRELDYRGVLLVTCDFHMKRATWLFSRRQLIVTPVPTSFKRSATQRLKLITRELGAALLGEIHSWLR